SRRAARAERPPEARPSPVRRSSGRLVTGEWLAEPERSVADQPLSDRPPLGEHDPGGAPPKKPQLVPPPPAHPTGPPDGAERYVSLVDARHRDPADDHGCDHDHGHATEARARVDRNRDPAISDEEIVYVTHADRVHRVVVARHRSHAADLARHRSMHAV